MSARQHRSRCFLSIPLLTLVVLVLAAGPVRCQFQDYRNMKESDVQALHFKVLDLGYGMKSAHDGVDKVKDDEILVLELFDPHCAVCKKFMPEMHKVAAYFNSTGNSPRLRFAKIDCKSSYAPCSAFGVEFFPSFAFGRPGQYRHMLNEYDPDEFDRSEGPVIEKEIYLVKLSKFVTGRTARCLIDEVEALVYNATFLEQMGLGDVKPTVTAPLEDVSVYEIDKHCKPGKGQKVKHYKKRFSLRWKSFKRRAAKKLTKFLKVFRKAEPEL